jgi:hypothetical protein
MTKRDLIEAYIQGSVDRRGFVRRLSALGISAGAAVAYAQSLAPAASAAPGRNAAGFVVRAQTTDAEYGTACVLQNDGTGVSALLGAVQGLLATLAALDDFSAGDFDNGVFDALGTIRDQQQEHLDALTAILGDLGQSTPAAPSAGTFASADAFLSALASALDGLVALYAGVTPALIDSGEVRQTVTTLSLVAARQAAYVDDVAGNPPLPNAIVQPVCP